MQGASPVGPTPKKSSKVLGSENEDKFAGVECICHFKELGMCGKHFS